MSLDLNFIVQDLQEAQMKTLIIIPIMEHNSTLFSHLI